MTGNDPQEWTDPLCDTCNDAGEHACAECSGIGETLDHGDDLRPCECCDGTGAVKCDDCPTCLHCGGVLREGDHKQCWRIP